MSAERSSTFTLITGANSGIGLELARQAAADGRDLILVARNATTLETAASEFSQRVTVHTIAEDLSEPGAAERVYDRVQALGAEVDCLINDAGFGDHGSFATVDLAKQERYEPGKWTVKDILQHLADSSRIMSYQALMLSRNDKSVLQGFDQELHVKNASAAGRTVDEMIEEIKVVRASTVSLFNSFDDEMLRQKAINWKYQISVLAMGFTIIGHQTHHLRSSKNGIFPYLVLTLDEFANLPDRQADVSFGGCQICIECPRIARQGHMRFPPVSARCLRTCNHGTIDRMTLREVILLKRAHRSLDRYCDRSLGVSRIQIGNASKPKRTKRYTIVVSSLSCPVSSTLVNSLERNLQASWVRTLCVTPLTR